MSWLYSIVFVGLMLSSDGDLQTSKIQTQLSNVVAVAAMDETEKFEQTYPLDAGGRVSVSNINGSITIGTWERSEVKLEYVKTADTKENLAEVAVKIDARQNSFSVETDYGDWNRRNSGGRRTYGKLQIEYRLTVPRSAILNEIETVNGTINIANAGNMTKASTVNGEINATNLRGTANLSTVNGTVVADFDQLLAGGKITLETVNGTVNLMIPSDADATIKADTVNGSISNDFGLPVRKGQYVGRDLYGRVGSGAVQIRLTSVNGGLSVKRKNDGKNVNPATNLLNSKSEDADEENWGGENNSGIRQPKPPKPPKAPKVPKPPTSGEIDEEEISRLIKESLKDASKEIANIKPELDKLTAEALLQAANGALNSAEMQKQIKEAQAKYEAAQAKYGEIFGRSSEGFWTVGSPSIEKKSNSFTVKGTPKVKIEANDCAVFVRGWDKPEVKYTVTRISKSRSPKTLDLTATQNGSDIDIKIISDGDAVKSDYFNELNRIRVEVFVPKKSDLKITTGGEIRLEGVSGEIDLQGVDEAINVRDADGKLSVGTADGRIRVIGFRGAFAGKTSDGVMNLEGDFQSFNALAADGTIVLTLPENADATLESNAEIENEGVNLIRDNGKIKSWRVGKGGKTYRMNVQDGKVIVRSANNLTANRQAND